MYGCALLATVFDIQVLEHSSFCYCCTSTSIVIYSVRILCAVFAIICKRKTYYKSMDFNTPYKRVDTWPSS